MEGENKENQNIESKKRKNWLKAILFSSQVIFLWELLKIAAIAFLIVAPIRYFIFQPFIVSGESMSPNFESGDYLIVDEVSYRFSEPQRGDVIVFKWPKDTKQRFIKRVIGLPGENVRVANGRVEITKDNKTIILTESYLPKNLLTNRNTNITLKADEYFVMGDNRENSYDSRDWGIVPKKDIIGKTFLRLFPVSALSAISQPIYQTNFN